jgi:hypothetical protein
VLISSWTCAFPFPLSWLSSSLSSPRPAKQYNSNYQKRFTLITRNKEYCSYLFGFVFLLFFGCLAFLALLLLLSSSFAGLLLCLVLSQRFPTLARLSTGFTSIEQDLEFNT